MTFALRWAVLLLLAWALVGCAPAPLLRNPDLLTAQAARERQLGDLDSWTLRGRLAISANGDGGSGSLEWTRSPSGYRFVLSAPLTGRSFRLQGNNHGVQLLGLEQGPIGGGNAHDLLRRAFGWQVPMAQLVYWVRGMRAPHSPARMWFDEDGLPQRLVQDGWTIEYRDWYRRRQTPLPRRVFARHGDDHVRLAIRSWSLR